MRAPLRVQLEHGSELTVVFSLSLSSRFALLFFVFSVVSMSASSSICRVAIVLAVRLTQISEIGKHGETPRTTYRCLRRVANPSNALLRTLLAFMPITCSQEEVRTMCPTSSLQGLERELLPTHHSLMATTMPCLLSGSSATYLAYFFAYFYPSLRT